MAISKRRLFTKGKSRQPAARQQAIDAINAGLALLVDREVLQLLPGDALAQWGEVALPAASAAVAKYTAIRIAQSYSKPRAEATEDE